MEKRYIMLLDKNSQKVIDLIKKYDNLSDIDKYMSLSYRQPLIDKVVNVIVKIIFF